MSLATYEARQRAVEPAPVYYESERKALIAWSYLLALFLPPIGLILGITVITRPERTVQDHGIWIVVFSCVLAPIIWGVVAYLIVRHAIQGA